MGRMGLAPLRGLWYGANKFDGLVWHLFEKDMIDWLVLPK
jgi:hypothetical protein